MTVDEAIRVLRLTLPASADDVRKEYRLRAQLLHPDKVGDNPKLKAIAEAEMRELNEAYAVCGSGKKAVRGVVRQAPPAHAADYNWDQDERQEVYTPPPTPTSAKRGSTVGTMAACVIFGPIWMFLGVQDGRVASVIGALLVSVPCTVYLCTWLFGFLGRRRSIAVGLAASAFLGAMGAATGNDGPHEATENDTQTAVPVSRDGGRTWVEQPLPLDSECKGLAIRLQAAVNDQERYDQLLSAFRERCLTDTSERQRTE